MGTQSYADLEGFIWLDGAFVPAREAKLHVLTHALHYASAVFEGERAYNGKVFKLREHTDRLHKSAGILGFEIPYTADQIDDATRELIKKNNLTNAYVRPIAWRGSWDMGVSTPHQKDIHVAITSWDWPYYFSPEDRAKGIALTFSPWARPAPNTAPTAAKAAGLYMICTISKNLAEEKGFNDSLFLDWRGQIAEATGANIFMVKDGVLMTPTPDCFLDGITRRTVMQLARDMGIKVVEKAIMPAELEKADEVFLVGTAVEVSPVGRIDDWRYKPGKITMDLVEAYTKLVNS